MRAEQVQTRERGEQQSVQSQHGVIDLRANVERKEGEKKMHLNCTYPCVITCLSKSAAVVC
jgi:hypothetical protein